MFNFYTELLKTRDEAKYTDARAVLETAGMKYRTYQRSAESTQLAAASYSHLGHRPKNFASYDLNNPGLGPGAVREISHDGPPEDVEYIIEVCRRDFSAAKKLVG